MNGRVSKEIRRAAIRNANERRKVPIYIRELKKLYKRKEISYSDLKVL